MQTRSMSEDPALTNQIEHLREKMRLLRTFADFDAALLLSATCADCADLSTSGACDVSFAETLRNAEGDRKANIDLLEATKQANQEEIRRLKDDNKALRAKLIALHKVGRAGRLTVVVS